MQESSNLTLEYEFKSENIAKAVEVMIRFRRPDRSILEKTRSSGALRFVTDGTDGLIKYTFSTSESMRGEWDVQGQLTYGAQILWTDWRSFYLHPNLPAS